MAKLIPGARGLMALALVVSAAVGMAQSPAATPSLPEEALLEMTNAARSHEGLAPLRWNAALARAAQGHGQWIVQNSQLSHQYPGEPGLAQRAAQAGAHFQTVAENIAEGPGVDSIQKQWMKSPPHRANILDPTLDAVGFAVVEQHGTLYAVADFARAVPSLSTDQVEAAVAGLLAARGVKVLAQHLDARQTCEMSHGSAGGSAPAFVMRWQSSDLSRLPDALEAELHNGKQHSAAVGACASANAESGFTSYRVAVLLY